MPAVLKGVIYKYSGKAVIFERMILILSGRLYYSSGNGCSIPENTCNCQKPVSTGCGSHYVCYENAPVYAANVFDGMENAIRGIGNLYYCTGNHTVYNGEKVILGNGK
jgi:hypothetical protein